MVNKINHKIFKVSHWKLSFYTKFLKKGVAQILHNYKSRQEAKKNIIFSSSFDHHINKGWRLFYIIYRQIDRLQNEI